MIINIKGDAKIPAGKYAVKSFGGGDKKLINTQTQETVVITKKAFAELNKD